MANFQSIVKGNSTKKANFLQTDTRLYDLFAEYGRFEQRRGYCPKCASEPEKALQKFLQKYIVGRQYAPSMMPAASAIPGAAAKTEQ